MNCSNLLKITVCCLLIRCFSNAKKLFDCRSPFSLADSEFGIPAFSTVRRRSGRTFTQTNHTNSLTINEQVLRRTAQFWPNEAEKRIDQSGSDRFLLSVTNSIDRLIASEWTILKSFYLRPSQVSSLRFPLNWPDQQASGLSFSQPLSLHWHFIIGHFASQSLMPIVRKP